MTGAGARTSIGASSELEMLDFDDFFENSVAAMHWLGADGTILRVNQAELDLLGYCRADVVGHPVAEFHVDGAAIEGVTPPPTSGDIGRNWARANGAARGGFFGQTARQCRMNALPWRWHCRRSGRSGA